MAELENEELEEDYLDNLLNSVSGPLPEENGDKLDFNEPKEDNLLEFDKMEDDNLLDLNNIEEDNILNLDNIGEDDLLDLNGIEENNILNLDNIEEDDLLDLDNIDDNSLLNIDKSEEEENAAVSDKSEDIDIESNSFDDDQEDIEQLLNMLDTDGIDEDIKDEEINKIADELEDIPDLSSIEDRSDKKGKKKKKKDKKKGGGFFSRKTKNSTKEDSDNSEISPDDNEQIIKSVEGSFYEGFDLSELEGLADLEDIEDRTNVETEKTKEEIKAEKEKKKKEKAEKKAEKNKLKKEKQEAKKAKKAEKQKNKEKKKKEKPKIPEEKIKISISTLILIVSIIAATVVVTIFGGRYFWYNSHINEATDLLIERKYSEAYNSISGLNIKEKDKGLYEQIKTLMYIEKEYESYFNCIRINMNNEALDSLLQGVDKYHFYKDDAAEYGVSEQAKGIYENILNELSSTFGLTEEMAKELISITDTKEYSRKVADIVNSHLGAIEAAKSEANKRG